MEILYFPELGIHKLKIIDSEATYDFGPALTSETEQKLVRRVI